jgi:hypothetical protein
VGDVASFKSGQANPLEQSRNLRMCDLFATLTRPKRNVGGDHSWKKICGLQDHADPPPQFLRANGPIILAINENHAACRLIQSVQ